MYYFESSGYYGITATICADSKEQAIEKLKEHKKTIDPDVNSFEIQKIQQMIDGYSVKEYAPGEILFGGNC